MDISIDINKCIDDVIISNSRGMGTKRLIIGDAEHNILTIDGLSELSLEKLRNKLTEWLERDN